MPNKINCIKLPPIFSFVPFILLLISFNLLNYNIFGQNLKAYYPITEIKKKDGKWGIKANGKWVKDGITTIKIKASGDWIILPIYDRIELVGYQTQHGRYAAFYAWKADKLDVFGEKSLTPIISNISIEDTIHIASFSVFFGKRETKPFLENKLCGWNHKQAVILPQFDSIRLAYDSKGKIYLDEVKVYKNGQMGLMSMDGNTLIPLGDYNDIGPYSPSLTLIYGKLGPSGDRLMGMYFNKNNITPLIYTSVEYTYGITVKYSNTTTQNFYSCKLPNGTSDYFEYQNTGYVKLSKAFSIAYEEIKKRNTIEKQNALAAEAARRRWVNGLVLFAKGGGVGIKDSSGKIVLPARAISLEYNNGLSWYSINAKDDIIKIKEFAQYGKIFEKAYSVFVPLKEIIGDFLTRDDIQKFAIKAKLNPYNNMSKDYKSYFYIDINEFFTYNSGFTISNGFCSLCNGEGRVLNGYDTEIVTNKRVVKDGSTTYTKKNYLANERVDANGRIYVPTTTQTIDNYKTVEEKDIIKTEKYKTCTLCNGKAKFSFATILWDSEKNEFVLTSLYF